MSGEDDTDKLGWNDVPLTPGVARGIVVELFQEQQVWERAALATKVAEIHRQRGGQPGQQSPLNVVKRVLSSLNKGGKVKNFAFGRWRWTGSPVDKAASADTAASEGLPHPVPPGPKPKLPGRVFGDPIDFRGLRHEPVNEDGVVFLFGMVAHELGYLVEAVQAGFPDCEAKRQVGAGKWQQVRIEFEYESRNFYVHRHPPGGCDVIVCWRHNWPECPSDLEVVELSTVIGTLTRSRIGQTANQTLQRTNYRR